MPSRSSVKFHANTETASSYDEKPRKGFINWNISEEKLSGAESRPKILGRIANVCGSKPRMSEAFPHVTVSGCV
jgi:hypothetical protein